ncbi:MAG: hypothetical protein ACW98D_20930 [Promethearchaeota archaeon]
MILGVLAIVFIKAKEGKHKVDYYSLFLIGLIWIAVGLPLNNSVLWIIGLVFLIIGLANKDKWKKNKAEWKKMNKRQKNMLYIATVMLFLLLVAGIIVFWLTKAGIL